MATSKALNTNRLRATFINLPFAFQMSSITSVEIQRAFWLSL